MTFPDWELAEQHQTPRLGRKPRIREQELLQLRDALVYWFEDNWPELSVAIRKAKKPADLLPALKAAKGLGSYPVQPPLYQHPEEFLEQMFVFVKSSRYRGKPRNLANAMAGLPRLSWKRSFDICTSHRGLGGGARLL